LNLYLIISIDTVAVPRGLMDASSKKKLRTASAAKKNKRYCGLNDDGTVLNLLFKETFIIF
jgi:hypothetical protein